MQSYHLIIKTKFITIFVKLTLSEINMKERKKKKKKKKKKEDDQDLLGFP